MTRRPTEEMPTPEIYINGRRIEEFRREEKALHYDNEIVKNLGRAIMLQAVRDFIDGEQRIRENKPDQRYGFINYVTAKSFFGGSLFEQIASVILPDADVESIRETIKYARKMPNRSTPKRKLE